MTLKEAKDYIDREVLKNKITAKKPIHKRGYIFDEKLDILIPNLTRQKKALKTAAACWTAFLCPLPSVAWRAAMLAGVDVGFGRVDLFRTSAGGIAYVVALELIQVGNKRNRWIYTYSTYL